VASADAEFLQVAALYRGRPDFDAAALVAELVPKQALYIKGISPTIHAGRHMRYRRIFHPPEAVAPVPHSQARILMCVAPFFA
jgi:hypothetical protein